MQKPASGKKPEQADAVVRARGGDVGAACRRLHREMADVVEAAGPVVDEVVGDRKAAVRGDAEHREAGTARARHDRVGLSVERRGRDRGGIGDAGPVGGKQRVGHAKRTVRGHGEARHRGRAGGRREDEARAARLSLGERGDAFGRRRARDRLEASVLGQAPGLQGIVAGRGGVGDAAGGVEQSAEGGGRGPGELRRARGGRGAVAVERHRQERGSGQPRDVEGRIGASRELRLEAGHRQPRQILAAQLDQRARGRELIGREPGRVGPAQDVKHLPPPDGQVGEVGNASENGGRAAADRGDMGQGNHVVSVPPAEKARLGRHG